MSELISDKSLLKTETKKLSFGTLTIIKNSNGITVDDQNACDSKTILALKLYKPDQTYSIFYPLIDTAGNLIELFQETEGILPKFFRCPENKLWVSLIPYHPDKEMEITIPVFERANIKLPKSNRPFVGDFCGSIETGSFFISCDTFSSSKPDKWLHIEFKNKEIKKKHNFKIELPSKNKVFISKGEIHLMARVVSTLTHRKINEQGIAIQQRELALSNYNSFQIISLSFIEPSFIVITRDQSICLVTIEIHNEISEQVLLNIGSKIYNLWEAQQISSNTLLFRFTHETGNGWFVIQDGIILECFVHVKEKGYRDLISNEFIEIGYDDLILSGASKTTDNCYSLSFYPRTENRKENDTICILNRQLK